MEGEQEGMGVWEAWSWCPAWVQAAPGLVPSPLLRCSAPFKELCVCPVMSHTHSAGAGRPVNHNSLGLCGHNARGKEPGGDQGRLFV